MNRLFLFDVDSTLINEEVIDLIASHANVSREVQEITELAMNGLLDFQDALSSRVRLLAGLSTNVLSEVGKKITLTTGAAELISNLQTNGDYVAVISGGFIEVISPLMKELNIQRYRANSFQIIDGTLTGQTEGPIVDRNAKGAYLLELKKELQPSQVIAIGDGANDIEMIKLADVGIAFCAKSALKDVSDIVIEKRDLREILNYL
jgi:phosphoserine phosphatase